MISAVALGYILSQALLPTFLGTQSSSVASTVPGQVTSPGSSATYPSSDPVITNPTAGTTPEDLSSGSFAADLPSIAYFQVQLIASSTYEGASAVLQAVLNEDFSAEIVLKGPYYTVQAGAFFERDKTAVLIEQLKEADFPDSFVSDWSIELADPRIFTGEAAITRKAQETFVYSLVGVIQALLEQESPEVPDLQSLPPGLAPDEDWILQHFCTDLSEWLNDSGSLSPDLEFSIITLLRDIYTWFD